MNSIRFDDIKARAMDADGDKEDEKEQSSDSVEVTE